MRRAGLRRTADPALTFALGSALTLLLSYPTVVQTEHGAMDLTDAAVRIVVVFTISWCALHAVASLIARWLVPTPWSPPSPPGAVRSLPGRDAGRPHADAA